MIGGIFFLASAILILLLAWWVQRAEKKGADPRAIHSGFFAVKDDPLPKQPPKKTAPWMHDHPDLDRKA